MKTYIAPSITTSSITTPSALLVAMLLLLSVCFNAHALSAAEAAEQARNSTGGKVLQVKPRDDGRYKVKVLMPSGQVKSISVGNPSTENSKKK